MSRHLDAAIRRAQAAAYAWGREDAGDRRIRECTFSTDWHFATYAGDEAESYYRGERGSLSSIQDQYARFVAWLTLVRVITHS